MSAAFTAQLKVGSRPQYLPFLTAAGMGFFHLHGIPDAVWNDGFFLLLRIRTFRGADCTRNIYLFLISFTGIRSDALFPFIPYIPHIFHDMRALYVSVVSAVRINFPAA